MGDFDSHREESTPVKESTATASLVGQACSKQRSLLLRILRKKVPTPVAQARSPGLM